jgi:hypothetical protein
MLSAQELASPSSSREGEGKKYCHPESSEGTNLTFLFERR